ncbi:MAG: addiction module protein [Verrucomicrobiota bacterium]
MDATLPLDQMSVQEKLRAIETLWEDLRKSHEGIPVPEWHRQALRESEERVQKGEEKILDWEEAKSLLRQRFE